MTFTVDLSAAKLAAARVATAAATGPKPIPALGRSTGPLSSAQQRLWFVEQVESTGVAYTIPLALRIDGPFDADAFAVALGEVARRHDALRTIVRVVDELPELVVAPEPQPFISTLDLPDGGDVDALVTDLLATPFDTATGPLLRAWLVRVAAHSTVVVLAMHHLISDEWSLGILLDEAMRGYHALTTGLPAALPDLRITHTDFTAWEREVEDPARAADVAFWAGELADAPSECSLPLDRPRPARKSYAGDAVDVFLGSDLTARLRAIAAQYAMTPFMVLSAAWAATLYRFTGDADVVVATPVAGRRHPDLEPLIGYFVNTIPLRTRLDSATTFSDLLETHRATCLAALAHQNLPYDVLTASLGRGNQPLTRVFFAFQNTPLPANTHPDLTIIPLPATTGTSKFDLNLQLFDDEDTVWGNLEYDTDLFDRATAASIAATFSHLVHALTRQPHEPVARARILDSLTTATLTDCSASEAALTDDFPRLAERFVAAARRDPDAVALREAGTSTSYGDIDDDSARIAGALRARGVQPGDLVSVCLPASRALVATILGVLRAGAAYLPLDPHQPEARLRTILGDAGPALVVADAAADHGDLLAGHAVAAVAELLAGPAEPQVTPVAADGLAYVIYTSGSTGRPKGVEVSQRNVARLFDTTADLARPTHDDVWLLFHSPSFDFSVWELFGALLHGGALVIPSVADRLDPARLWRLIADEHVTVLNQTPMAFHRLTDAARVAGWGATSLRLVVFGGEALDFARLRDWFAAYPQAPRLVNMYGITEITVHGTAYELTPADVERPLSVIGRPLPDLTIVLLDGQGQLVPPGAVGEICVAGPGVALGYRHAPELTRVAFTANPWSSRPGADRLYHSGDLGRLLPDGTIAYLGRADDQVKVRGFRVELGEVTSAIIATDGVRDAAVIAATGPDGSKALVAYVVGEVADDITALTAALRARLPEYMVPSRIVALDALPVTATGKLDRRQLPEPPEVAPAEVVVGVPVGEVEELVAGIWGRLLQRQRVGLDENFFECGGHSLLSMQLLAEVARATGRRVVMAEFFESPTLRHLIGLVQASDADGRPDPIPRLGGDEGPLSSAQARLWFLESLGGTGAAYTIPVGLDIDGDVDAPALASALDAVIARHEVLHSVVALRDGVPRLDVRPAEPVAAVVDASDWDSERLDEAVDALVRAPFDLREGPLVRAAGYTVGESRTRLVLAIHHLVADEWSIGVLLDELLQSYAAITSGRAPELPPLPIQFTDFSAWEATRPTDERADDVAFWGETLADLTPDLGLPLDRPRPAQRSWAGATVDVALDADLTARVRDLASTRAMSPFQVLSAAWTATLHRFTGNPDVVVATPVAGRSHPDTEPLVGYFVNTLPLRTRVEPGVTFADLLAAHRDDCLAAFAHQGLPFDAIAGLVGGDAAVLTQAFFSFQNTPLPSRSHDGLEITPLPLATGTSKFDVNLRLFDDADTIWGDLEYDTDLFEPGTAAAIAEAFTHLLGRLVADPALVIDLAPAVAPERAVAAAWCSGTPDQEAGTDLVAAFERTVALMPDALAVADDSTRLSYAELDARSAALARAIAPTVTGPGDVVGVLLPRSTDLLVALLATARAGAAYLPLDPAYPLERLAAITERLRPVAVVAPPGAELPDALAGVPVLAPDAVGDSDVPLSERAADDPMYVISTSGSTGRPKSAAVRREAFAQLVAWYAAEMGLAAGEATLVVTSPSFDLTQKNFWAPLVTGGTVRLFDDRFDPARVAELIGAEGVALLNCTPSMFQAVAATGGRLEPLRCAVLGGEVINAPALRDLVARRDGALRVTNSYGPTECTDVVAFHHLAGDDFDGRPVPIGRPIPGTELLVLDEAGNPVPIGIPGELWIGGASVGLGYLDDPERSEAAFRADPAGGRRYRTGDLVRRRVDGELVYLGRADDQVKLRGFRIELGDIEAALSRSASVTQAAVRVWSAAEVGRDVLVAYVVASGAFSSTALLREVAGVLPAYMVPQVVVALDELPASPNGKVDRRRLPVPDLTVTELETAAVPPRTWAEEQVLAIWQRHLASEGFGVRDSFFARGGDSLGATQVVAEAARALGGDVALADFLTEPTVERLAALAGGVAVAPIPRRADDGSAPVSRAQRWLLAEHPLGPDDPFHAVALAVRLTGPVTADDVAAAVQDLAERHPVLRTGYRETADGWVQEAHGAEVVDVTTGTLDGGVTVQAMAAAEVARPFDLAAGAVLRARVLATGDGVVLLLVMHHIATDNFSMHVLGRDLMALIAARRRGETADLPELAITVADHAAWEQDRPEAPDLARWRETLAPLPPALPAGSGDDDTLVVPFTVDAATTDRLVAFAREHGTTTFTVVLAAYAHWLRGDRAEPVQVYWPGSGRTHPEQGDLVGYFVRPLIARLDNAPDFASEVARAAEEIRWASSGDSADVRRLAHEVGSDPFRYAINLISAPSPDLRVGDVTVASVPLGDEYVVSELMPGLRAVEADVALVLARSAEGLSGMVLANPGRVDADAARRLAAGWPTLLAHLLGAHEGVADRNGSLA